MDANESVSSEALQHAYNSVCAKIGDAYCKRIEAGRQYEELTALLDSLTSERDRLILQHHSAKESHDVG